MLAVTTRTAPELNTLSAVVIALLPCALARPISRWNLLSGSNGCSGSRIATTASLPPREVRSHTHVSGDKSSGLPRSRRYSSARGRLGRDRRSPARHRCATPPRNCGIDEVAPPYDLFHPKNETAHPAEHYCWLLRVKLAKKCNSTTQRHSSSKCLSSTARTRGPISIAHVVASGPT